MVSKATHYRYHNKLNLIGFINYDRLLALCYLRFKSTNDMFKKKYTKWQPLGNYTWAGQNNYIVFVRKNLKTGMMQFKTKMVHSWWRSKESFVPLGLIDTKEAWADIVSK